MIHGKTESTLIMHHNIFLMVEQDTIKYLQNWTKTSKSKGNIKGWLENIRK